MDKTLRIEIVEEPSPANYRDTTAIGPVATCIMCAALRPNAQYTH